jgi:glycosyltransferase involved in cell wall biosynthesis
MGKTAGHITVALCAYNAEATIRRAIESVLRQSYENFDLYVVDDASEDETGAIAAQFARVEPHVHLIRLKRNVGTYAGKNIVLKHFCRGEFFAHQDADDYSWPQRFEQQVAFMRSHKSVGACGTGIDEFFEQEEYTPRIPSHYPIDRNDVDSCFHRINRYDELIPRGYCFQYSVDDLPKLKIAMTGSLFFRTPVLKTLGGFDGHTRIGADSELLWRLLLFYDFANLSDVLYSRLFHPRSLTASPTLGHRSAARARYATQIMQRSRVWQALYEAGKFRELKRRARYDFYDSQVAFERYDHAHLPALERIGVVG